MVASALDERLAAWREASREVGRLSQLLLLNPTDERVRASLQRAAAVERAARDAFLLAATSFSDKGSVRADRIH